MKAADLLKREPLGAVIEETLGGFLRLRFGGDWSVRWSPRSAAVRSAAQQWLCNLNINAIFRCGTSSQVFEVVRREFATTPVRWRRPIQRVYFAISTSRTFASRLAQARLEISPDVPDSENWLLVAGGSKLRVIDTGRATVYCCRKTNAAPGRFRRELEARREALAHGVRVPRILGQLSADCVLEEMVVGTPPNRLASRAETDAALDDARLTLSRLHRKTLCDSRVGDYMDALVGEANSLGSHSGFFRPRTEQVSRCVQRLQALLAPFSNCSLATVVAHGDFQPGNILWDGRCSWVIDWEHTGRRQASYDELVLVLRSRFPKGLATRALDWLRHLSYENGRLRELALFFLEELVFHLRDKTELPMEADCNWTAFLHECESACRLLSLHSVRSNEI